MKASASLVDLKKLLLLSFANKAAFQRMSFANSLSILSVYAYQPIHLTQKKKNYMRKRLRLQNRLDTANSAWCLKFTSRTVSSKYIILQMLHPKNKRCYEGLE